MRALLALSILALGATTQLSCSVNDYCLNCATDGDGGLDGGSGDGDSGMTDDAGDIDAGCVQSGPEICDGIDNDCDGLVDDGVLPGVNDPCPNQNGVCAGGTMECVNGALKCNKTGTPEVCDGLDNNCSGTPDEGNPGGGAKCGTDLGECVAGQTTCDPQQGMVICFGFIDKTGDPELCDAKDNDCDGNFDENIGSLGNCGPTTNDGECQIGSLMCQAGAQVCVGAVFPKFETCNNLDDDCDTNIDEIFNKQTDPTNCGTCGTVCQPKSKTCINTTNNTDGTTCTMDSDCTGGTCATNSQPRCSGGVCGFVCNAGFQNLDTMDANGCEYNCFASGAEECDGADNDCDGNVDEGLTAPPICLSGGECGATAPTATCTGAGGWTCTYPGTVQFPETLCDGKNNDCDANTDENQPNLGQACDDGKQGVCKGFGSFTCNAADLNGPAICNITMPGQMPAAQETCDDKDNDCDGLSDEGGTSGNLLGQEWVDIGGGKQMMKYEASKPDATSTDQGARNTIACSKPNVQPWTNLKYGQALAACQAIGATLCGESTWHRACSNVTSTTYPLAINTAGTYIEAEDYSGIAHAGAPETACGNAIDDDGDGRVNDGCPVVGPDSESNCTNSTDDDGDGAVNDGCPRVGPQSWVPDYTSGFSAISALEATANIGATVSTTNAPAQSPRVDYAINFPSASANYHIWVRMFSNTGNDDTIHLGVTALTPPQIPTNTVTTGTHGTWIWRSAGPISIPAAGVRTLSIYMGEDGVKIDKIFIVDGTATPTTTLASKGGKWAYATNPNTYQATVCNGDDLDTNTATPEDDDGILPGGSLASCYSTVGTDVFDMSGNVKEWTLAHQPGENPIRGGASNNTGEGISCPLNFTLADDNFFFPNIGFRCCRPAP